MATTCYSFTNHACLPSPYHADASGPSNLMKEDIVPTSCSVVSALMSALLTSPHNLNRSSDCGVSPDNFTPAGSPTIAWPQNVYVHAWSISTQIFRLSSSTVTDLLDACFKGEMMQHVRPLHVSTLPMSSYEYTPKCSLLPLRDFRRISPAIPTVNFLPPYTCSQWEEEQIIYSIRSLLTRRYHLSKNARAIHHTR